LNWTFDIFAEFPTFVFSKTFSCHFRSHVLSDSTAEKRCANYTGYFVGTDFPIYIHLGHLPTVLAALDRAWNKVLAIKVKHFLLKKVDLEHFSCTFV
jgi:hypothetical protein